MSVLVVGTVAYDSIEAPAGSVERILGGSASYFALAASYFAPVRMVGVIGQDFSQDYLDLFTQRGIDIDGSERLRRGAQKLAPARRRVGVPACCQ